MTYRINRLPLKPLLLLLWVFSLSAKGQTFNPGGIATPIQWYVTDSSSASPQFHSLLTGNPTIPVPDGNLTRLNFHVSLQVNGQNPISIPLGTSDLHDASYFTVCQSQDTTKENTIW